MLLNGLSYDKSDVDEPIYIVGHPYELYASSYSKYDNTNTPLEMRISKICIGQDTNNIKDIDIAIPFGEARAAIINDEPVSLSTLPSKEGMRNSKDAIYIILPASWDSEKFIQNKEYEDVVNTMYPARTANADIDATYLLDMYVMNAPKSNN